MRSIGVNTRTGAVEDSGYITTTGWDYGWSMARSNYSLITDIVDLDSKGPGGEFTRQKFCSQISLLGGSCQGGSQPYKLHDFEGHFVYLFEGACPIINTVEQSQLADHCPPPPTSAITPFGHRALLEMTSQFPPEVDIVNFLIDLKEIPGLVKSLVNSHKLLADAVAGKKGPGLAGGIQDVSGAYLAHNFGAAPLVGDLKKIIGILKSVRSRLEWLRKNRNKWVRVGSRGTYSNSDNKEVGLGKGINSLTPSLHPVRVAMKTVFNCTAMVKQNLPWLDEWEAWVRGVLGAGGLSRPFSVIWERVPFSWVVDYFIPVGEYLEAIVFEHLEDWSVKDVSWSMRSDYLFRMILNDEHDDYVKDVGRYVLRSYVRGPGFPPRKFYFGAPSLKQLSLLAAAGT